MATSKNKSGLSKLNKWIIGVVAGLIILVGLVLLFGTPSAETVFNDMNEKMLETKSVTIDQTMTLTNKDGGGVNTISSKLYMDLNSSSKLLAKGNFTFNIISNETPITASGDIIKIGEDSYVKYDGLSSTSSQLATSLSTTEAKLKGNWVKVRDNDSYASMAEIPLSFTSNIMPTPFANLNDAKRKNVVKILQSKSMYNIEESSSVDIEGVSAYKYVVTYDKDQFKKAADTIARYNSYFKSGDTSGDDLKTWTVWVNKSTRQIIKIEFIGTSSDGDYTGKIEFSGYNKEKSVEQPATYSIESELVN